MTKQFAYSSKILLILMMVMGMNLVLPGEQGAKPFTIGNITAKPGTMASGYLQVARVKDPGTTIPLTIINGNDIRIATKRIAPGTIKFICFLKKVGLNLTLNFIL